MPTIQATRDYESLQVSYNCIQSALDGTTDPLRGESVRSRQFLLSPLPF